MIGLVLAAALQLPAAPDGCHGIESSEISRLAAEVRAAEHSDQDTQFDKIVGLANYWRESCPLDREKLNKNDAVQISSLLKYKFAHHLLSSILIDVGPSLRYASASINAALKEERAREAAFAKESPVWLGSPPRSFALRCLQIKARTGKKDERECWTIRSLQPLPEEDDDGGPITVEAKVIFMDGRPVE